MPSSHPILCRTLPLLPSIFPSIRVFSNKSVLRIRWPKYWSFSFNISPSNEYSGLISFRMDWLDLLGKKKADSWRDGSFPSPAPHLWEYAHGALATLPRSVMGLLEEPGSLWVLPGLSTGGQPLLSWHRAKKSLVSGSDRNQIFPTEDGVSHGKGCSGQEARLRPRCAHRAKWIWADWV